MTLGSAVTIGRRLKETKTDRGKALAGRLVSDTLALVTIPEAFLPLFDEFLEAGLFPNDAAAVIEAGRRLGIDEDVILERLNRPVDQLKGMILGNLDDDARYRKLVDKIDGIDPALLAELAACALSNENLAGMAALLGIALGDAAALVPPEFAALALGHKGIGGGTNLLKQWFMARDRLESGLRDKIKQLARDALVELGLEWAAKGGGDSSQGLVPQNEVKPFSAGDDLDRLDLDGMLEAIIAAGKPLDRVTDEDLWVHTQSKGRAVIGVLIDISGSMSGKELAVCAIAVVMLLARLQSEEVAIALFESDTHVVKGFGDHRELDAVADELLELKATGGTRVDAALKWVGDQFEEQTDADFRLLFVLSDFCFFEGEDVLREHGARLADLGVRWLGASHGYKCEGCANTLAAAIPGQLLSLADLGNLPRILHDAIVQIGDRGSL